MTQDIPVPFGLDKEFDVLYYLAIDADPVYNESDQHNFIPCYVQKEHAEEYSEQLFKIMTVFTIVLKSDFEELAGLVRGKSYLDGLTIYQRMDSEPSFHWFS